MKLNTIVSSLLIVSFFMVSTALTVYFVLTLKKSNKENMRLFKEELLELNRESFADSSNLFFASFESRLEGLASSSPDEIVGIINSIDSVSKNVFVYDISKDQYILEPHGKEAVSLLNRTTLRQYTQENTLNLKHSFDSDNFPEFLSDSSGAVSPAKLQLRFYNDLGLIAGYEKTFSTVKLRIDFIQRKNDSLFYSYLILSIATVIIVLSISVVIMIWLMRSLVIEPLKKIVFGLEQIEKGVLDTRIDIKSGNEVGEIAHVFNKMSADLEKSRDSLKEYNKTLEKSVKDRTEELDSKLKELGRMNEVMLGRELKMVELKREIEALKAK